MRELDELSCSRRAGRPTDQHGKLQRLLGWGHHGFRVASRPKAILGLCILLAIPFMLDQLAFQIRMRDHNPDLKGWRAAAAQVAADPSRPLYGHDRGFYIYPPFFLTLTYPLTLVSEPVAAAVFETAKWVALFLSLQAAWRLCSPQREDAPPIVALGSILLTWRFIDNDLGQGNVNLFVLLAIVGGCWLVSRGRQYAAGALIAVAVCVKVTPAIFLVYFLYKGWWRPLVGAAAGAAICLLIWPGLFFGWENNLRLLAAWFDMVVASFLEEGRVYSIGGNQSLTAILNRLLGPALAIKPDVYLAPVVLPLWAHTVIRVCLFGSILALLGIACRGRLEPRRESPAFAAEISLVAIAMLMLSGITWKGHFVVMLLPNAVLLAYLADARHRPILRGIAVCTVVSSMLCLLTGDILTPVGADYAEAFGLIMLGAVFAAAGVVLVRRRLRSVATTR